MVQIMKTICTYVNITRVLYIKYKYVYTTYIEKENIIVAIITPSVAIRQL